MTGLSLVLGNIQIVLPKEMYQRTLLFLAIWGTASPSAIMHGWRIHPNHNPKYQRLAQFALQERPQLAGSKYVTMLNLTDVEMLLTAETLELMKALQNQGGQEACVKWSEGWDIQVTFTTAATNCGRRYDPRICRPVNSKTQHICTVRIYEAPTSHTPKLTQFNCTRTSGDNDEYEDEEE